MFKAPTRQGATRVDVEPERFLARSVAVRQGGSACVAMRPVTTGTQSPARVGQAPGPQPRADASTRAAVTATVPDAMRELADGVEIDVVVVPRASRSQVVGRHGDRIEVQLAVPPVDGTANTELVELLAAVLDVPTRAITIVRGPTSKRKTVRIAGVDAPTIRNVFVYHHPDRPGAPMAVELGVEVTRVFEAEGEVVPTETPAGEIAVAVHVGRYDRLYVAHDAIESWRAREGRTFAGTCSRVSGRRRAATSLPRHRCRDAGRACPDTRVAARWDWRRALLGVMMRAWVGLGWT